MHDTDRHALREAVEHIEDAHAQVNRMVANEHEGFAQTDPEYLTPRELHALKQIDADLRSACTRLWDMVERSRDQAD